MLRPAVLLILVTMLLSGCILNIFSRSAGFDTRPISVQTLSFFNQRTPSRLAKRNWKGDWVFRRDRLDLIDQGLRLGKPDLMLVQELMERRDSRSESDIRILEAGVLSEYEWRKFQTSRFDDTRENQFVAISLSLPLRFVETSEDSHESEMLEHFPLGDDGYLMVASVDYEGQPLTVLNVHLTQTESKVDWLEFIQERAIERMKRLQSCPKRLIVGGYIPGDVTSQKYKNFIEKLQLRDAADGFCQIESKCFTATPINELFMSTIGDESPARVDRIFTHRSAYVSASFRNFDQAEAQSGYAKEFGLSKLWATQRFGWFSSLRLARCNQDELL